MHAPGLRLAGCGPVAVSAIRDVIETGDPFLAAVVTKGAQVSRSRTWAGAPAQRSRPRPNGSIPRAAEGCGSVASLENDHRVDWAASHVTVLDLLDRLCGHHHDPKTIDNWALVDGTGKRPLVPPGDPRHPRNAPAAA